MFQPWWGCVPLSTKFEEIPNLKTGWEDRWLVSLEEGSVTIDTKDPSSVTYPRYVLRVRFKTSVSHTPCVSVVCNNPSSLWLYSLSPRLKTERGPSDVGEKLGRVRWVLVVSFIPFLTTARKLAGVRDSSCLPRRTPKHTLLSSCGCLSQVIIKWYNEN